MGLTFLSPLILAGAALVAVPIVLHLIMRREPKHLVFPALRFIQKREESNRRRLRLRHLLLLLLRCAGIVLLALAIARPSVKSAGFVGDQEAPIAAALVFDTSVRMDYQHENKTRLQAAQETALWLLPQLPADSEIAVIDSSSLAGAFAVDPAAARHRVERLTSVAASQPWIDVVESALRLVHDSVKERKEVYLFTDLARGSWPGEALDRFRARLDKFEDVAIYLIDVGVEQPRNFALGDLKLSSQTVPKNSRVRIATQLTRTGPGEERSVAIYLADRDGQLYKSGEQTFGWLDGQSLPAEFELKGLDLGTHHGVLEIVGDDALSADNLRYFTFEARPAWKVLIAAPPAAVTMWLHDALIPIREGARFEVKTIALDQLADEPLEQYSAVFLLDPTPLSSGVWDQLRDYVSYGGGLGIWLGSNAGDVEKFNTTAALEVLPGALRRQAQWSEDLYFAPPDLQHPTLRGFISKASAVPWSSFPVYKYWQLNELKEGVNVVIPYTNGRPALVEHSLGRGRVLTMTTPVSHAAAENNPWNILATGFGNWPFFVLTQEMGAYLVGSGDERFNYAAGDTVVMQLPEQQRSLIFTLQTPQNLQIPQTVDQRQGTLTVTTTDVPGHYELQAGGSEGGIRRGFSTNVPEAVTRLDRITKEDLDALFGAERYRLARNQEEITRDVHLGRVGVELYPLLIVLVALVLGLEHVLANRFYRRNASVTMEVARPASLDVLSSTPPPLPPESKQPAMAS
ncbi:MAG: BatA domain-containing protein [Pirellulales bacterium]